ncbi:MAG: hypothetical protein JNM83_26325 [Myxococcales bacterium]|nr:hypothetical protein [Myxococcales bacterium]
MRFCDGTCRMRAWRIGGYVHSRQRARFARQPSPKFHQSPALLRVASHQRRRAEVAEKSNQDLQQQRSALAQENEALKKEVDELRRQLDEARQAQQAAGKAPGSGQGPHKGGGPRGERQRGASADRPEQDLAARLRHCQQMYRELSAVAEELRRIHEAAQKRSADQDRLLQEALTLAIEGEPPLSGEWSAESAARVQRRAAILTTENTQLRRNIAEVVAERQQLSARLLSILLPGQAAAHASGLNYDVSRDPLIPQKRLELTLLDAYAVWQSRNMRHVTARTLDPNKPLDEQALEAALAARWRLITQPPLEVRNRKQPPRWTAIGFCLDPASERYLLRQSQRRMDEMNDRMRTGSGGNVPD